MVITSDDLKYEGGDVIISSPRPKSKAMVLESTVLRERSPMFARLLLNYEPRRYLDHATKPKKFWHFRLDYDDDLRMVVLKDAVSPRRLTWAHHLTS